MGEGVHAESLVLTAESRWPKSENQTGAPGVLGPSCLLLPTLDPTGKGLFPPCVSSMEATPSKETHPLTWRGEDRPSEWQLDIDLGLADWEPPRSFSLRGSQ